MQLKVETKDRRVYRPTATVSYIQLQRLPVEPIDQKLMHARQVSVEPIDQQLNCQGWWVPRMRSRIGVRTDPKVIHVVTSRAFCHLDFLALNIQ
jgi:hypothetical protein